MYVFKGLMVVLIVMPRLLEVHKIYALGGGEVISTHLCVLSLKVLNGL